ncbi:MAG: hypothetical protein ACFFG0_05515 [Candidatus Thorarchaeota archaeon]
MKINKLEWLLKQKGHVVSTEKLKNYYPFYVIKINQKQYSGDIKTLLFIFRKEGIL